MFRYEDGPKGGVCCEGRKLMSSWRRGKIFRLFLLAACLLAAGCSPKIRSWSQESFRGPGFSQEALRREGLALMPVIIMAEPSRQAAGRGSQPLPAPYTPPRTAEVGDSDAGVKGSDGYQVILDETLLGKIRSKWPELPLVPAGDALRMLNDAGMSGISGRISQEFPTLGFDAELLRKLGSALHTRYVLIGRGTVTESKSDASVNFVWTFGRKSVLRSVSISAQIWDTSTQKLAWEGSGVGYNRLSAYEKTPLTEEMASEAVKSLIANLGPEAMEKSRQ
jgi:hypothetical protein